VGVVVEGACLHVALIGRLGRRLRFLIQI